MFERFEYRGSPTRRERLEAVLFCFADCINFCRKLTYEILAIDEKIMKM